jgi:hypothetical protein
MHATDDPLPSIDGAIRAVHGARESEYGHPATDLNRIALAWTAYLAGRRAPVSLAAPLEGEDVCALMVILKTMRLARSGDHADSWVDIVGYVACRDRIVARLGSWRDRVAGWIGGGK